MPKRIGDVLLAYRKRTGITQTALGRLLGFTQTYISKLENGVRDIDDRVVLIRISERLRIDAATLGVVPEGRLDSSTVDPYARNADVGQTIDTDFAHDLPAFLGRDEDLDLLQVWVENGARLIFL